MAEPQLLAILIVIAVFLTTFAVAAYLIWRVMNRPGNYIGSRMDRFEAAEAQRREDAQHRHAEGSRSAEGYDNSSATDCQQPQDDDQD